MNTFIKHLHSILLQISPRDPAFESLLIRRFLLCLALFLLCLIPRAVSAASPLFLDSFGPASSEFVQGWIEDERYGRARVVSPGARPESPTPGFVALKEASITQTVTTVGYQDITLSYYWRGMPTVFPGDYLYVYWRPVGGS